MPDAPLLSVIIPMYQAERYIPGTLLSLIRQPEFSRMEVICVDDGSSDHTLEQCRWIMAHYPGIRLISLPHGGVSRARNAGIQAAVAPYVAFLDADDCWEEDFFDTKILQLLAEEPDILGFGWATTSAYPEKHRVFPVFNRMVSGGTAFPEMEPRSFCAYFYKKSMLDTWKIRFPEHICYNEDEQFKLYCLYHAEKIRFFPRVLFTNRLHVHSLRTGRYSDNGRQQLIQVWKDAIVYFSGLTPPADSMISHCRNTLETLLDKMNRESCLDENCIAAAKSAISPEYCAYAHRILADTDWHTRLFCEKQPIVLMQPNPSAEISLGKVFSLLPFSEEQPKANIYLFSPTFFRDVDDITSTFSAFKECFSEDTLLIFDLTLSDFPPQVLWNRICASLVAMGLPCLAGYRLREQSNSKVVCGLQQLAADRIYQIFSSAEPGQVRMNHASPQ